MKKLSQGSSSWLAMAAALAVEPEINGSLSSVAIGRQPIGYDKQALMLLMLLMAGSCMTLHFVAGAQPPQPPPLPPPVRSASGLPLRAVITEEAKRELLVPVDGRFEFVDPSCKWKNGSDQVELLVMTLKCDAKPMMRMFESFMPHFNGPKHLRTLNDLLRISGGSSNIINGLNLNQAGMESWNELLNLDCMIDHFYAEAMYILSRRDFCTYPTVLRLSYLKSFVLGSRLLSYAYDLISINYHSICLVKALSKLPKVPYLVRDVVNIYIEGVDKPVQDLNQSPTAFDSNAGEFKFNVETAIARNGPLRDVTSLLLVFSFNQQSDPDSAVEAFKSSCKEFLIELDERWQSMEMMSKMLSTEGNGIERFTNYVMRTLIPTKHADVCSQLCAVS